MLRLFLLVGFLFASIPMLATPCTVPVSVIDTIRFEGNEKTKVPVMLREITFTTGDSITTTNLDSLLEENRRMLFNLRLFHTVDYTYTCRDGRVAVVYSVQERFYLYPIPIFDFAERNFSAWLERKDLDRLDYGVLLIQKNFRGRNEELRLRLQRGFNKRIEFTYRNPYLFPKFKLGADFGVSDYRSRTISYNIVNHRQALYEQEEGVPIRRSSVFGALYYRENVQRQSIFRMSYHFEKIADAVAELNPLYFGDGRTSRKSIRLDLIRVVNTRNNFVYPLTGSYFEIGAGQAIFLGNTGAPFTALRSKYVRYFQLSEKFYYTVGAEAQARLAEKYAFTDNVALGYRSQVRGYELYVVGGQHHALFKQGISRELLKMEGIKIGFIDNPKLNTIPLAVYLNAFTDAGYAIDNHFAELNPLTNRWLLGAGFGVHVVTFYDIVGRAEYTFNREGDRGLYLSAGIPF